MVKARSFIAKTACTKLIHSTLCFATDGSAKREKPGQAGWGYTACLLSGTPAEVLDAAASTTSATQALYEESGRVVTNDKAPEFLGAAKGTNSTGELSAVYHALTRANEVPYGTQTTVLVLADSQLAICTTTGAWAARNRPHGRSALAPPSRARDTRPRARTRASPTRCRRH